MFTGIVTHVGHVKEKTIGKLVISTPTDLYSQLTLGMSIAVDGICLTVTHLQKPNEFSIDFMPETENKTNIRYLQKKSLVNLELPVTPETLLAGHIMQGHVDGAAQIQKIEKQENSRLLTFSFDPKFMKYVAEKGSIALNGISLTVISVGKDFFTVGIIPHTWNVTMLHETKVGDFVNVEVDVLAKYLEKLMTK